MSWLNWKAWVAAQVLAIVFGFGLGWLFGCGWRGIGTFVALFALAAACCVTSRDGWKDTMG